MTKSFFGLLICAGVGVGCSQGSSAAPAATGAGNTASGVGCHVTAAGFTDQQKLFIEQVCNLTNAQREQNKLSDLVLDPKLTALAQDYAKDMSVRGYFSHSNPEGVNPFQRMAVAGIPFMQAAENIAMGQETPDEVVTEWMNSPGHRKNILTPELGRIGVGFYNNVWVQDFTN